MLQWIVVGSSLGFQIQTKARKSSVTWTPSSPTITRSPTGFGILAMDSVSQQNIGRFLKSTHRRAPSAFVGSFLSNCQ
ncbi:hypothetical protein J5N97_000418 [Dioscorea zingiberensis]|uniref:Uncharacterized protein n=1 Tax=Dioscorea zingiberensis TaxID=325984 RepID=A0A9D5H2Y5_9LILI|nr:hypothetical protein J5N97_000418 [Dioscorea zingiberensis]